MHLRKGLRITTEHLPKSGFKGEVRNSAALIAPRKLKKMRDIARQQRERERERETVQAEKSTKRERERESIPVCT